MKDIFIYERPIKTFKIYGTTIITKMKKKERNEKEGKEKVLDDSVLE